MVVVVVPVSETARQEEMRQEKKVGRGCQALPVHPRSQYRLYSLEKAVCVVAAVVVVVVVSLAVTDWVTGA